MTVSTQGIELHVGSRAWRATVELLSSMRFAISLLTVICIASIIGTVLKQHEPVGNYVNQFGPFWAEVFQRASLFNVYSAWWFLLILAFLVVSTSLCVARNTPKILADLRSYKENIREQSLKAFGHKAQAQLQESPEAAARRLGGLLAGGGWKVKLQSRETCKGTGWMLAAKAGAANKLGYIAAHSAIVLVCLGGLLDGDLVVRAQMLFAGKVPFKGGGMIADVSAEHRLSERNPTFRGNLMVAEGTQSSTAILSQSDGILLQELPFAVELKKFIVEYYSTGMPKLFASDIVIHDKATGEKIPARVEVNHPASYKGVEIYQSSFDDGGSALKFKAQPLRAAGAAFDLQGIVGGSSAIASRDSGNTDDLTVEYTGLRVINVENLSADAGAKTDVRGVDLRSAVDAQLGAANKHKENKSLRNVGPSFSYKLRDNAGQAREFNNYMLPVDLGDGTSVFLLGMRESPAEPFRYLRVPADADGSMDGFLRLSRALADTDLRKEAVRRYATKAIDSKRPDLVEQLAGSANRALTLFAGTDKSTAGLQAISDFIEGNVPETERNKAGEVLVRILNGVLYELVQLSREKAGLKPLPADAATQTFMTQAVLALSDVPLYPAPFVLSLTDFTQVQASVFQVARAPGKTVVYLGCALLILGVFAMLYVRERRLWIWLEPAETGSGVTAATMALSTNRKTMDGDKEFDHLKRRLLAWKE
ncbi:cytochrome c biogenesis protein ResB [Rhodoferax mekongensis]|uniref:cytochrome c biogenesis protein ResB n=1 Tax=Rhodoferax mekongensis TaxID=3068341 RepID=UPI0028BDE229|nr:cytochrome c biogenesis protein ResB [Rhodoferax sp. TBRC 17199]MDT7516541.1 cytochrome c biogenesis protein ResB [Rhodoferax sp. TBRC 17199]